MTNLDDAASTDVVDAAAVKKKAHTAKKNFHNNKYESESVCVCVGSATRWEEERVT